MMKIAEFGLGGRSDPRPELVEKSPVSNRVDQILVTSFWCFCLIMSQCSWKISELRTLGHNGKRLFGGFLLAQ